MSSIQNLMYSSSRQTKTKPEFNSPQTDPLLNVLDNQLDSAVVRKSSETPR